MPTGSVESHFAVDVRLRRSKNSEVVWHDFRTLPMDDDEAMVEIPGAWRRTPIRLESAR